MNRKIKIGAFSKLCRVTVKTLRHYEELGLLIPAEIDEWTGYRYYEVSQFPTHGTDRSPQAAGAFAQRDQ